MSEVKNEGLRNDGPRASGMTRRKMVAVTAAGVAIGGVTASAFWRWMGTKTVEIVIKGPFPGDGFYQPEELEINARHDDFQFLRLQLDTGKLSDNVFVTFTFAGKEDASRAMDVSLIAHDAQGHEVARSQNVFEDPRIVARRPVSFILSRRPVTLRTPRTNIRLSLPEGMRIGDLGGVKVVATERPV